MVETLIVTFAGWLLLAAASYRCRRDLQIASPHAARALRVAGIALFAIALIRCGAPLSGERWVRFIGGAALSAGLNVVGLSLAPRLLLRPVAALLAILRQARVSARRVPPRSVAAS